MALLFLLVSAFHLNSAVCPDPQNSTLEKSVEASVSFHYLLPNQLPFFQENALIYGPTLGIPVFDQILQFSFFYGSMGTDNNKTPIYLIETSYRWDIQTPFFKVFFAPGLHSLFYTPPLQDSYNYIGGFLNLGIFVGISKQLDLLFNNKFYFQKETMLTFGATFKYSL